MKGSAENSDEGFALKFISIKVTKTFSRFILCNFLLDQGFTYLFTHTPKLLSEINDVYIPDVAPPPGAYDPKLLDHAHGGLIDSKVERFKDSKG